ncbi:MAG TPA: thymidine kinase [Candidatus Excrementavichristensenella intestinipullorum]|nr:thymidine kinase [Candidatus Excrementavichristensenella intestinipullorum]
MAKLYFRYGAMGSSKTANAIMVRYNYMERGQKALMLKPAMERRDGEKQVRSRSGLTAPCAYVEELDSIDLGQYDCLIVDEAQFLTKEQVKQLVDIVDERDLPVICYGLRADFKGDLFPGSLWLMAWADAIEEVKTVCWCGRKATCNARIVDGKVAREGEQVVLGGNENYVSLCRKHWRQGNLGLRQIRQIHDGKRRFMTLLLQADPDEDMLDRYLDPGDMYALFEGGRPVTVAVVLRLPDGTCELKNLATDPDRRRRGLGSQMVRYLMELYAPCGRMYVGTGKQGVAFYQRLGFTYDHTIPGFFSHNYPEPIYEEGELLTDMVVLAAKL